MTLFAHGPITEMQEHLDGRVGKCRKCGQWYDIPEGASCIPSHCQLWNPECWHPPKALDPEPDLWLLGEIPLWYESTLKARYPPEEPKGEVIWRPAPYIARPMAKDDTPDFDPGHENLIQIAAKELCPDGVTEKEFKPDHEGNSQTGGKFCDPEG